MSIAIILRKEAIALGLRKYFTGVPCRRGHIAERYTAGACVECVSHRKAELYQQNREAVVEYMRVQGAIYRKNNPEKRAANSARWVAANRDKINARARAAYAKDPERRKAIAKASFLRRREAERERARVYRQKNKGLINFYTRERKACRLHRTPAWLSAEDKRYMKELYRLAALRTEQTGIPWHVDHIIPLRGRRVSGLHVPNNLQLLPASVNAQKGNRYG